MKKYLIILTATFLIFNPSAIMAAQRTGGQDCTPSVDTCIPASNWSCQSNPNWPTTTPQFFCQPVTTNSIFGKIVPPSPLAGIVAMDQTGAKGLSQFFSNLIALFYSIAAVVLVLMLVWGAFDWLTSGGDKEKVQSAQKKIINAIIGIILFAIAFAVIQILGHFTGFTFFVGQNP